MNDVLILSVVLAVAVAAAMVWQRLNGRVVEVEHLDLGARTRDLVGVPAGLPALLLFTTPTCRDCAAARAVLSAVSGRGGGVFVAEIDVATHPAIAREHKVLRAPTVLVVDAADAIRARVSGVPDAADLEQALAA